EANDAVPILKQLSALKALVDAGQTVNVDAILEANSRLGQISQKIQAAATQEAELVGTLRQQLGEIVSSVGGYIDDTGAIILPDAVLFEQGQASITPRLASFLAQACAPWLTALKESGIQIAEVKIEGHASSEWRKNSTPREAYLGNLDLSQRRSQSVLRVCLDFVPDQTVLEWARKHLIAVGYSSVRPVVRDGNEDQVASRRVVFSVAPDRNALIEEIESDASKNGSERSLSPVDAYDRTLFGSWTDEDADCVNTRHEMLAANNVGHLILSEDGCSVVRGLWRDPYSGKEFTDASDVEIDHLVPLYWAWEHGAKNWTTEKRRAFFNDPIGLFVVNAAVNQEKGPRGPLDWLPPDEGFQCQYVTRFQRVLVKYQIELDDTERMRFDALSDEICHR
ncbi:MAG: OmpA family protein, partial [Rhizobiaceae bacterium]|nr:OmpA family protein [Rhizobiaceae bacterium]